MGIMTLGLLGVAALFPVGTFYMHKAEIADRGSAIARSALADVVARGMLNPDAWLVYGPDGQVQISATLRSWPETAAEKTAAQQTAQTFTRQLAPTLRLQLALVDSDTTLTPAVRQWCVNTEFGSAYVLDPMGVASATLSVGRPVNTSAHCFPATGINVQITGTYAGSSEWAPWQGTNLAASWPIRRVTFGQNTIARSYPQPAIAQMSAVAAGDLFSNQDDLVTSVPDQGDLPGRQNWELTTGGGLTSAVARQWRGDYSWIVTVVPPSGAARDALADGGSGYDYDVSVVVFYQRSINRTDPNNDTAARAGHRAMAQNERTVRARVLTTSLSGGELVLERENDQLDTNPFDGLKVGEWLMLCGPHPASTDDDPRFVLKWYRVVAIEGGPDEPLSADGNQPVPIADWDGVERRVVTLRGPEWPWQPAYDLAENDVLSNWLCATICPGAVAVHTRTMQLEAPSPWSFE